MALNKTQSELVSRLVNRFNKGTLKEGWSLTDTIKEGKPVIFLSLHKLNEIEQAHRLAEKYPEIFEAKMIQWRLTWLHLKDDSKARGLL